MTLGINASNIRAGGGVTHLIELLAHSHPDVSGFRRVIVWAPDSTLAKIKDQPWLIKERQPLLNRSLPFRIYWSLTRLQKLAAKNCHVVLDLVATPGNFKPTVTICQNQLPFEPRERDRFFFSLTWLRLWLLGRSQYKAFRKADGIIFLSAASEKGVLDHYPALLDKSRKIVPHGINERFLADAEQMRQHTTEQEGTAAKAVYISIINLYKHQDKVAEAVMQLNREGVPVRLELIGPAYPPAMRRLEKVIDKYPQQKEFVTCTGKKSYKEIHRHYRQSDLFIFASTCETFGMILLEAMAAGIPIASSDTPVTREILDEHAVFFDAGNVESIKQAIKEVLNNPESARNRAALAKERAKAFSWERTARETFEYLSEIAVKSGKAPAVRQVVING